MTALTAPSNPLTGAAEGDLLDILYELLADESGEEFGVESQAIEVFLHEHARAPKSIESIRAFFAEHELPTQAEDYGRDPALQSVASGLHFAPVPPSGAPISMPPLAAPLPARESHALPSQPAPGAAGYASVPPVAAPSKRPAVLMVAFAVLAIAIAGMGLGSYMHAQDVERELGRSRLQIRSTDAAVVALEERARALNAELNQRRTAEVALEERVESFIAAETTRRIAEAEAQDKSRTRRSRRPAGPSSAMPTSTSPSPSTPSANVASAGTPAQP